jgi:hypothetical protein
LLLSGPRLVYLLRASNKAQAKSTYTSKLVGNLPQFCNLETLP